jgi:hypothetical protein
MAIMAINEMDELFDGGLDSKMDFLNEQKQINNDGIYRVDLKKVTDKKKGWKSVVRFLPNLTKEGKLGQSAIEKITHYVDIKNVKELSGWFDSAKNFNEKCALTDLYYSLTNSKNAILVEKAKCLKYSKKYYSYVLVIEDEQQPELVGKVMIFQYGKTIKDKILAAKNGEVDAPCNVFDLANGKNFVLNVKEIQTGDETYPDYKGCSFKSETSSLPIWFAEKGVFKNAPSNDGKIEPKAQQMVKDQLLKREHELEEFSPKRLSEDQQSKVNEIIAYLTGKSSGNFKKETVATANDFDFEESYTPTSTSGGSDDDDDFFDDLN